MSDPLTYPELAPLGLKSRPTDRRADWPQRRLAKTINDEIIGRPDAPRSRLLDLRTPMLVVRAWMSELPVPAGLTFSHAAWYGLGVWRVQDDLPDEVSLSGVSIEANAADVDGDATYAGWGDVRGETAAVVIARNMQVPRGKWVDAPSYLPGIEGAGSTSLETQIPQPEWAEAWGLPPGKYTDTAPAKLYTSTVYGPDQYPLSSGHTIGVYLVVAGTQIQAAGSAGKPIRGRVHVQLRLSRTTDPRSWRS